MSIKTNHPQLYKVVGDRGTWQIRTAVNGFADR